ncbi:unnamed protein product [Symbiodinium sp. CCMP2592]|nr:unnamed protein product [Symbiodinium sp. CCMP2592]
MAHCVSSIQGVTGELRPTSPFTFVVKSSLTGEQLAQVSARPGMSLAMLQEAVAQKSCVPASEQRLIFEGEMLQEDLLSQLLRGTWPDGTTKEIQVVKVMKEIAGTHMGTYASCTCTPAADEVCWGYSAMVKNICPRCGEQIASAKKSWTDGCRRNGDAYGWVMLVCEHCGLKQKHGWDDA